MAQRWRLRRSLLVWVCTVLCTALAGPSCSEETGAPDAASPSASQPNVLLITLDTTRADRLGCYGCPDNLTPNLDSLAAQGTLFDQAISQAAVTPVAHASILTGLDPYKHGLRVLHGLAANRLADAQVTLAEVLKQAGYETGAVVSAFPVSERFGLHQGFDAFDADFGAARGQVSATGGVNTGQAQRRAGATTDLALAWLESRAAPFFLWVHYFDPHDPHLLPPRDYLRNFTMPPEAATDAALGLRTIYDIEVRYMDLHVGRLLDSLEGTGLLDDTVVVVVADHGEGLGDHDWWTHGILYQEQVRVPLLIRAPGQPAGRRVARIVRCIDIMPTVLELSGVDSTGVPMMDGRSLVSLLGGADSGATPIAYCDSVNMLTYNFAGLMRDDKNDMLFSVIDWPWKLIHHRLRPDESELYNLVDDPAELRNLLADRQDQVRRLRDELRSRDFQPRDEAEDGPMSPEDAERLESLGYVERSTSQPAEP